MSAYYTKDFAKRACRAMLHEFDSKGLFHEMKGFGKEDNHLKGFPKECTCELVNTPKSELQCHVCELGKEKHEHVSMVGEDVVMHGPLTVEPNRYLHKISVFYRNTGHSPVEHLVRALEARRTDPRIVDLARNFQCPVCQELKCRVPRPQVSLEPTPPKWAAVQADNAFWRHPHTLETAQFTLMIDEGCRFRVGKVMVKGDGGISGAQLIRYYQEGWKPVFGKPRKIRVDPDPAGAWRANDVVEYMNHEGIECDNIPAEAHWGISHVERAIDCTKAIMTKLAWREPEMSAEEALSEALRTENEREIVRAFSPAQHALGRAPDLSGRFDEPRHGGVPEVLCENPDGDFRRNVERMKRAEQAMTKFVATERLEKKHTREATNWKCLHLRT